MFDITFFNDNRYFIETYFIFKKRFYRDLICRVHDSRHRAAVLPRIERDAQARNFLKSGLKNSSSPMAGRSRDLTCDPSLSGYVMEYWIGSLHCQDWTIARGLTRREFHQRVDNRLRVYDYIYLIKPYPNKWWRFYSLKPFVHKRR